MSQVIKIVSEKSLKKEFTPFQISGLTIYSMKVLIYTKVVLQLNTVNSKNLSYNLGELIPSP